jgi:lysylphosphatidylglycerol synthetase-like protein (DUF2156 family)
VAYLPVGKTWLAAEPLSDSADLAQATREFMNFARDSGALPAFLPVTSRFASLTGSLGLDCAPIGISPYFDLDSWKPSGRRAHALRSGVRQATRANVTVEEVSPDAWPVREIEAVAQMWNESRRAALFGWVFAPDRNFMGYKKLFVARDGEGKLAAFATASPLPARNSFYLEDIQRDPGAPKGATDLLFATAMNVLREQGAESVTLGTVPLAGMDSPDALRRGMYPIVSKGLKLLARHGESVYNFAGVQIFKSRLAPSWWEHEYAAAPSGGLMTGARVAFATLRAVMPAGIFPTVFGPGRIGPNRSTYRNGARKHA